MAIRSYKAFTLVEVAVTIVIIALITGTSMTILDRAVGALNDMRLRNAAFETARQNMEALLSLNSVKDTVESAQRNIRRSSGRWLLSRLTDQ